MTSPKCRLTAVLDVETMRALDALAYQWHVSRTATITRLVHDTVATLPEDHRKKVLASIRRLSKPDFVPDDPTAFIPRSQMHLLD